MSTINALKDCSGCGKEVQYPRQVGNEPVHVYCKRCDRKWWDLANRILPRMFPTDG